MLSLLVCVPFMGAALIAPLASQSRIQPAWVAGLTALLGLALVIVIGMPVYDGEVMLDRRESAAQFVCIRPRLSHQS